MFWKGMSRVLLVIVVCLSIISPVFAADAKPNLGKVDVGKIYQSYKRVEESNQNIRVFAKTLESRLDLRNANRLLTDPEMTELLALKEKTAPTDAEKASIKALEDISKQRDGQLRDLAAKKDQTEPEKATLAELQARSTLADKTLTALAKDYEKQAEEKRAELSKKVNEEILVAVKAVAEAQGLAFVVDEQAVLYGGVDVTDSVIERLNKK